MPHSEYVKSRYNSDGLQSICKVCAAHYQRILRCEDSNNIRYGAYGGRGIYVSSEFHDYMKWHDYISLLPGYLSYDNNGKKLTIDRIDNSLGYERGNIRWASRHTQKLNQRKRVNSTSQYYGVSWNGRLKKWVAQIQIIDGSAKYGKRKIHIGVFKVEEDAARAYDAMASRHHGIGVALNFPEQN